MKNLLFLFSFVAMLSLAWHGANAGPPDDVGTSQEVVVCLSDNLQAPVAHFDYAFEASANLVYDSHESICIVYNSPPAISQYASIINKRLLQPPDNFAILLNHYNNPLLPFHRPLYWPLHFV